MSSVSRSEIVNADFQLSAGTTLISCQGRGPMTSGGGTSAWGVLRTSDTETTALTCVTYGYANATHNFQTKVIAIRLDKS